MPTSLEQYDSYIELYRNGKVSDAIDGLKKLTENSPEFALAYNALAAFVKRNGNLDEAIKYAEDYCKLTPNDPFGYTVLSAYYFESGDRQKAEDAISSSISARIKQHENEK
ncbi:MAG: tetratricopeptide repeat protein [Planctomycetaceae bacterium]|jgi:tetratricopeptide (TPR) repeat protein|nr:tetratricopeptide repeat protein [Planctomycetaceae bacterium]